MVKNLIDSQIRLILILVRYKILLNQFVILKIGNDFLSQLSINRINKFRDLYFKNQKLRKQLKLLNVKLNEKLQKIKFQPSKRKKTQSVDLNVTKPTKALQRQLQNAYKQISMYKKQIATFKSKGQSQATYEKYKNLENQITYKDIQISQVQAQLKSIQNVKKLQDKTLIQDVQNDELQDKLKTYQRQFKQGQQKLKDIAKKSRKRQQQYKKQQAYQVALEKKLRNKPNQQSQQLQPVQTNKKYIQQEQQVNENDFIKIKKEIISLKTHNQNIQKKIDFNKKILRDFKKKRTEYEEKFRQKELLLIGLNSKLQSYNRLIKDGQKEKQTTGFKKQSSYNLTKSNNQLSKQGSYNNIDPIQSENNEDSYDDQEVSYSYQTKKQSTPMSNMIFSNSKKDQRKWKGKPRIISYGFANSIDLIYKYSGILNGFRVWFDQANIICGLIFLYFENGILKQNELIGNKNGNQIKWQLLKNDKINKLQGSFTEQGYLSQLIVITEGVSAKLGIKKSVDKFICDLEKDQYITGFHAGLRKLGKDNRITEIGFLISKSL